MNIASTCASNEDGAVTVDWVVLTAGLVAFGAIVVVSVSGGVQHVDSQIGNALTSVEVQEIVFDYGN